MFLVKILKILGPMLLILNSACSIEPSSKKRFLPKDNSAEFKLNEEIQVTFTAVSTLGKDRVKIKEVSAVCDKDQRYLSENSILNLPSHLQCVYEILSLTINGIEYTKSDEAISADLVSFRSMTNQTVYLQYLTKMPKLVTQSTVIPTILYSSVNKGSVLGKINWLAYTAVVDEELPPIIMLNSLSVIDEQFLEFDAKCGLSSVSDSLCLLADGTSRSLSQLELILPEKSNLTAEEWALLDKNSSTSLVQHSFKLSDDHQSFTFQIPLKEKGAVGFRWKDERSVIYFNWSVQDLLSSTSNESDVTPNPPLDDPSSTVAGFTRISAACGSGDGSKENPKVICTPAEWIQISERLNAHYLLGSSLNFKEYAEISPLAETVSFTGSLDGNGYEIVDAQIKNGEFASLMGKLSASASVRNLGLRRVHVHGGTAAGLASVNAGTIEACRVHGLIQQSGGGTGGGIVGRNLNTGRIRNSYFEGKVTADLNSAAGGISGENNGQISNVYSVGLLIGDNLNFIGGISGTGSGLIENSLSGLAFLGSANGMGAISGSDTTIKSSAWLKHYTGTLGFTVKCKGEGQEAPPIQCRFYEFMSDIVSQKSAVFENFGAADKSLWIWPDNGGLPQLNWEMPNAVVSIDKLFKVGRKISLADQDAYELRGFCSIHGASIGLTASDGTNAVVGSPSCQYGTWSAKLNLSNLAEGRIDVLMESSGMRKEGYYLVKDTKFCESASTDAATGFAGGNGDENNPYLICTHDQLLATERLRYGVKPYFSLRNNLDFKGLPRIVKNSLNQHIDGVFFGNDHVVSNVYNDFPNSTDVGFFEGIQQLRDLTLENIRIKAEGDGGIIQGLSASGLAFRWSNLSVSGDVRCIGENAKGCGGLTGYFSNNHQDGFRSLIEGSVSRINVISAGTNAGLVGANSWESDIQSHRGEGYLFGNERAGGFLGYTSNSSVSNSIGDFNVIGTSFVDLYCGYVVNPSLCSNMPVDSASQVWRP